MAVVEDQVITVEDVRRQIVALGILDQVCGPPPTLSNGKTAESLDEFAEDVIRTLVDRALVIREFESEAKRELPANAVDNAIAQFIKTEFRNDDSSFVSYLHSLGKTQAAYRRETEADLIYQYGRDRMRRTEGVISLEMCEEYYRKHAGRFYQDDAVHLRLIQFNREDLTDDELQTKAEEAIKRLSAGVSFEFVAQELSQDKRRESGGDWGWQQRTYLKEIFSDIVFEMKRGNYTDPIIVPEGAFILYVQDRRYAGNLVCDEVRDEIENLLREEKATAAENQWLKKLRESAYVKYY
ncbi:MAG TPA: peptidyl-prolyl cis-trans isomerase [Opitutaceae bacterium]|nr:peptidyl-prolyl cis-trans isomerase [Opitutaceae bacterium]